VKPSKQVRPNTINRASFSRPVDPFEPPVFFHIIPCQPEIIPFSSHTAQCQFTAKPFPASIEDNISLGQGLHFDLLRHLTSQ
jgi:hypothetical protein